jgi:Druantia protein DruA
MDTSLICQGREIDAAQIAWLRSVVSDHPQWSRHRITQHICSQWNWRTYAGRLKTIAARSLIDKLEQRELIVLPPIQVNQIRSPRPPFPKGFISPECTAIECALPSLTPLAIHIPSLGSYEESCVRYYLTRYHYLGFNRTVGENLKYLVRDRCGRDVACLLFGSAAWKTAPRDSFIGWDIETRQQHINFMTNNSRFLILPSVRVPHLASHILAGIMRRIRQDWMDKYAHPVHLVETFVERDRFKGTCYKAANWISVGQTKGRSRQDRYNTLCVPVKDIYVYPVTRNFRQALCMGAL